MLGFSPPHGGDVSASFCGIECSTSSRHGHAERRMKESSLLRRLLVRSGVERRAHDLDRPTPRGSALRPATSSDRVHASSAPADSALPSGATSDHVALTQEPESLKLPAPPPRPS